MVNRIFWVLLASWGLVACNLNPFTVAESEPMPSPTPVPLAELAAHLETMWDQLDQGQAPKDSLPIFWQPAYSPLFPTAWPPGPDTIWVRYAYGQGQDMSITDGVRIAKPWARVEFRGDKSAGIIIPLTQKVEPFEVQGVSPLDAETQALMQKSEQISTYCLNLKEAPSPDAPNTVTMRRIYQSWLKYNGAIAAVIKPDHSAFFEWVNQ